MLEKYEELLIKHNEEFGLLGPREIDKIQNRHIFNSLNLLPAIDQIKDGVVIDIGSGAGLPGIPIAIKLPNFKFYLVEPKEKRVRFLELVKKELNLENVEIVQKSIQEVKIKPDFITARAVASLDKLLQISKHLWDKNTIGLFLKGEKAGEEICEAKETLIKQNLFASKKLLQFSEKYDPSIVIEVRK